MRRTPLLLLAATAACSSAPAVIPEPVVPAAKPVQLAPPDSAVSCSEWVRRAVASPDMDVEKVPEPLAYVPAPIPKRLPANVYDKSGRAEIKVKVLVDTLGKADMNTFTVVTTTSPRLTTSVKAAVAKWSFRPAEIWGCKVPRNFNWGAAATKAKTR